MPRQWSLCEQWSGRTTSMENFCWYRYVASYSCHQHTCSCNFLKELTSIFVKHLAPIDLFSTSTKIHCLNNIYRQPLQCWYQIPLIDKLNSDDRDVEFGCCKVSHKWHCVRCLLMLLKLKCITYNL